MNQNSLQVITTRNFNGLAFDCYKGDDEDDFWATREQIGRLLGYENPRNAITKIHQRYQERLDKFSKQVELRKSFDQSQIDTGQTTYFRNAPLATVYNFKGLLEICRWSNQPKANDIIDWLWGIADDLRRGKLKIYQNAVLKEREKVAALQEQIDSDRRYTNLGKVVADMPGVLSVQETSDFLLQHGLTDKGRNNLYKALREMGFLSRQKRHWNKPTRKGIEKGIVFIALDGREYRRSTRAGFTRQGLEDIFSMFFKEKYPLIALIEKNETDSTEVERAIANEA